MQKIVLRDLVDVRNELNSACSLFEENLGDRKDSMELVVAMEKLETAIQYLSERIENEKMGNHT